MATIFYFSEECMGFGFVDIFNASESEIERLRESQITQLQGIVTGTLHLTERGSVVLFRQGLKLEIKKKKFFLDKW